jgi:DNA-binding HxlR family transcriptional regulator
MTDSPTPLGEALARVGDRWSLLVIDALMEGPARFNDLSRDVQGIAPNILSQRLRHLQDTGVVVSEPYSHRPLRLTYRLTEEGQGLAGVLRLLVAWGSSPGRARGPHHTTCGTPVEARWYCPTCARAVEDDEGSDLRRM